MPTLDLGSVVGPKGDQGDPGPRGKQGVQGNPGPAATINGVNALTITAGDNITLKQEGSALEIGAVVPGKSLIINGDFRKPVNRNGKGEYLGNGAYCIDRWFRGYSDNAKLTIEDGYIKFVGDTNAEIFQKICSNNITLGRTVTASILLTDVLITETFVLPESIPAGSLSLSVSTIYPSVYFYVDFYNGDLRIGIAAGAGTEVSIVAAILEEGDHQTHFRQNADGQWEIIDPIDYDTQYLLCSQYSPITGEWVGSQHSNPSLLDNWYFPIPINQSNIASGEFWGEGHYGIDRWRAFGANLTKWVKNEGIYLCDGESINAIIEQMMEQDKLPFGETVTLSALVDNQLICGSFTANGTDFSLDFIVGNNNVKLQFLYNYISPGICNARVCKTTNTGGNALVKAAKLELGPVQTLAHKEGDAWVLNDPPPDYALELEKCQRYQFHLEGNAGYAVGQGDTLAYAYIPMPVSLRATPTFIGTLSLWSFSAPIPAITNVTISGMSSNMVILNLQGTGFIASQIYSVVCSDVMLNSNL